MNFFEFVSDQYASLHYQHYFQGLLMNKVPILRKMNWRLLATANVLYGSLRQENIDVMSPVDPYGEPTAGFQSLDPAEPYIELGYGIEKHPAFCTSRWGSPNHIPRPPGGAKI
jgi:hypothetical protein